MTLRYAIIGSGMMGQEHIRNIDLLDDAEVVAIADRDEAMRVQAQELVGSAQTFDDHRALLSADLADAYVIATPNHTHIDIGLDVIAAGKPILVEKPLCTTVDDCHRLKTAAERVGTPIWVAMEYRYMPPIAKLIERVEDGGIGAIKMLTIREYRFPFLDKIGGWNRFARNTGGTMVEKCCHFFDLMRLILRAEPVRVFASGGQDVNHLDERYDGAVPDIIDNGYVIVDFDNGTRALLELCMFAEGAEFQEHVTAVGDTAVMEALVPGPDRFAGGAHRDFETIYSPRDTKAPIRESISLDPAVRVAGDHHGSTFFQHRNFATMVRTGGPADVTVDDGLRAVEMGVAAELSIKTGKPVSLG